MTQPHRTIRARNLKTLITDRLLRGLKVAPAGKRTVIWDTAVPGLCVRVTDKGAASFNVMRRVKGDAAPIRRTIGIAWAVPFPAGQPLPYPLATAREDARAMVLDMAHGIDPKRKKEVERRAEAHRQANSFASVAEEFIVRHVAGLRTGHDVEAAIRRELIAKWGERPITDISRRDVVLLVEAIADSKRPYAAHRTFAHASKLFSWAMARHLYGIETSPCTGIHTSELAGKKEPRQRVLNDAEIRAVWTAAEGIGYPVAPFVHLLLLTGQRLREVAEMRWPEVDLDKALWVIPAARMKGDAAHEIPLPQTAVEILRGLPQWQGDFAFTTTGGRRPIGSFARVKQQIDAATKEPIAPWRFHDLRRTMRTGLGGLPVPNNVAELCIAHAQPGLHKVYDQHGYRDEKRRAFELWSARVMSIVELHAVSNVIPIVARG